MNVILEFNKRSKQRIKYFNNLAFDNLGRKCIGCGYEEDINCLRIDLIVGKKQIQKSSMRHYYEYYILYPDKIRQDLHVLCINCYWLKHTISK